MSMRCIIHTALRLLRPDARVPFSQPALLHARAPTAPSLLARRPNPRSLTSVMNTSSTGRKPSSLPPMEQSETSPPSQVTQDQDYDSTNPTIDIPLDNKGTILKRNLVVSSAVKKPSSLIAGLSELLYCPNDSTHDPQTISTEYWTLELTGDSITRIFAFETEEQALLFHERIGAVSDEMDHHARMSLKGADTEGGSGEVTRVTVTCTTHRPPGLSMRDIRLAKRINELADGLG